MGPFNIDLRRLLLLLMLGAIPILAINTQRQSTDSKLLAPFAAVVSLTSNSYANFSHGVRETVSLYINILNIKTQNQTLQAENMELKARLTQFDEVLHENERLNSLLDFKKSDNLELVAARVIGTDVNPDYDTIRISRGTHDGLRPFMAVISTDGAVGYIFRPQARSSQVLLLSDRNSVVDGHVQRSRARGLVEGHSRDKLKMTHLLRADDVVIGDVVVTSGINRIFPKGFPLGKVTSVEKDAYGISQNVELEPTANPYSLDEVFVVRKVLKDFEEEPIEDPKNLSKEVPKETQKETKVQ